MGDGPSSGWKDLLVLVAVFGMILGGLYLYTGVWPPAVIVESGSMMHRDSDVSYGRSWITFGPPTIDPGDLVLVKDVESREDVQTWAESGRRSYGMHGDVVIYYKGGQRATTPIIHRAMAWVDVEKSNGETRYVVRWAPGEACPPQAQAGAGDTCVFDSDGITIEEIGLVAYQPHRGGLITKGDNPVTNSRPDQVVGLSDIVQVEWIQGKARAEIPWLGLLKLSISQTYNEKNCVWPPGSTDWKWFEESGRCPGWVALGRAYAPKDLWVMLGVALFVLVGLPVTYDVYRALLDRRAAAMGTPAAPLGGGPLTPPSAPPQGPGSAEVSTAPPIESSQASDGDDATRPPPPNP